MNGARILVAAALLFTGVAGPSTGVAQSVFSDDFTGATSLNQWYFANGACLTAGSSTSLTSPNSVPGCGTVWSSYYNSTAVRVVQNSHGECCDAQLVGGSAGTANGGTTTGTLDPVGYGALRFTNGGQYGFYESGAIQSVAPFDASQGVQITFKTVSYDGDGGGGDGADGIGFQLMDGSLSPSSPTYNGIGSVGGSLGYSCSNTNTPYDGLAAGYLGLGIDEYGNFLNGTQLYPGYTGGNLVRNGGDNTALGYGFRANRIGLRGAGSVSWKYLNATYPTYYPSSLADTAGLTAAVVQNTCASGQVLDYSSLTAQQNIASCPVGTFNQSFAGTTSFAASINVNFITVSYSPYPFSVGQTIAGPNIPAGTTIINLSNTGNNTYILALSGQAAIPTTTSSSFYVVNNPNCPGSVVNPSPVFYDYAPIKNAYVELPSSVTLANEGAVARPTGLTTNGVTNGNVFLYNLKITQNGLLSLSYSVNGGSYTPVITNQSITASNGPLPAKLRFGFAGSSGYYNNIHELLCFKAAPIDASASSASTDQQQVGQLQTSSQAYFSYYDPNDWTGRVTAYGLSITNGVLGLNSAANWDSQCVLSGVSTLPLTGTATTPICPTTGLTTPATAQSPTPGSDGSRVMLTWNNSTTGGAGVAFEWPGSSSVSSAITGPGAGTEAAAIDSGNTSAASPELAYLRGVRTNEITTSGSGLYRTRDGVLGDVVDSSPVFVGAPNAPYTVAFKDRLYNATPGADATPENGASVSYASFASANTGRLNVIYVGANDGFLHGFRSGTQDAKGNIVSTATNDGREVLAYMPGEVLTAINNPNNLAQSLSNPQYSHAFYVDATPGTGDLFYQNAWHTWLVGGLGAGGVGLYALNITDPSTTGFNENNAAGVVMGDWNAGTITCVNTTSPNAANCGNNLGNTYGTPLIRRLHNGNWGAIFGNGYGSTSGDAGIYVMTVDQSSAAIKFYYLSTGTGSASNKNGIAYVTAADLDADHITDYVYAGDLQGNVWRFDLTSCAASLPASGTCTATTGWGVTSSPIFKTQTGQPITTPVVLASAQVVGKAPVLLVSFGTGQRSQFTATSATNYASGTQSLYGVWDWNFAAWNSASATQYASLSTAQVAVAEGNSQSSSPSVLRSANLLYQPYVISAGNINATNNASVTWMACSSGSTITCNGGQFGWYVNLPGSNGTGSAEQIVSSPILYQEGIFVNSTIPASSNQLSCALSTDTGNTYIVNVLSGGTFTTTTGAATKVSAFVNNSTVNTVGQNLNMTGSLAIVNNGVGSAGGTYAVGQNLNPTPGSPPGQVQKFNLPTNVQANRVTWTQLR